LGVCATAGFFIIFSYAILRFRLIEVTPAVAADQVLTTMKEGVAVCDAAGKILMTNRELQRVIGVEEKFLLNRHIGEIVQLKADGLLTVTALSQLSRGRSCLAFWKHDSGALLPIELSVCAIEDEDRRVGYVLIARDITEQMHMEAQLLKLSRAVNQSGSMIIITDANWRIEYANQKVIEVTGYQLMDLLGRNPRILKSGIMPPSIYKEMWDALLAGREWHGEFSNKKKNGELFWVFANISPIRDGEGKVTHYLAIEEDITDRKRSEQLLHEAYENLRNTQMQLIQAAKMESVGRLSAGVAHEVKNPLAITLMGIEYLRNSLKPLDPQISEVLEDMLAAVRRADRVIRGLLDFSSPRKVQLHPAHLNLVVEEAVQMMKYDFGHSHVHVDLQLKDDLPLVQLDTYKMEQVLVNLFMNATHAMEGGGELTVRTLLIDPNQLDGVDFKVNLGCFKVRCPHVALLVEDTGRGIPEDQLESIFDPFFTTKPTGKGTGLGLTVVRSMVEMHNGSIYFENRSLGGALAIILLPVYNSASQYNGQG
jgi:PAS domain S-box-containing protein